MELKRTELSGGRGREGVPLFGKLCADVDCETHPKQCIQIIKSDTISLFPK